ncbi:MAG: EAL domain-containing protein [Halomonas sp.]|nr:EAL domain-containing protein [Halomonas sp.]
MTRTSSILEALPDMVFVIDRESRFLVCNEHPDLPYPRHKFLGRTIDEALTGELGRELTSDVEKAFRSDEVIHHDYVIASTQQSFEARYKKIDQREVLVVIRNTTKQTLANAEIERLSEVARQTTNGVIITDEKGFTVWVNKAFTGITGYGIKEIVGQKPGDLLQGKDTDPATIDVMRRALSTDKSFNVDVVNYSKAGTSYWIRIACNPMRSDDGKLKGYIAIQTDITKERHDADLIRKGDRLLKSVVDANNIGIWRLNLQTGELIINDQWAKLLGYQLRELMPTDINTWESLTHPNDLANCVAQHEKYVAGQIPIYQANVRMRHKNGGWVWIETRGGISSRTDDGKPEWLLGTHFDVSARMRAEKTLLHKSKQMQAIVENMLDGVISMNQTGVVQTFNQAAEHMFGYKSREMVGRNISLLMPSPHREHHDGYLRRYFKGERENVTGRIREFQALRKDGTLFPMELGVAAFEISGETTFIGIVKDITDRKKRDHEIEQLAFYDSLTQLPNRRLLLDRLQRVIANCMRSNHYAALFFLDLDNFKNLNDSAGHHVGDLLLFSVAQRLRQSVRQSDTVARLSGDEFVILVENFSTNVDEAGIQAQTVAEKIMTELTKGFNLSGLPYNCSASVGVKLFNDACAKQEDLLKQADMAMYKSKTNGREGICFYDPQMQVVVDRRMEIEQDLHNALQGQQFQLHYQKQVERHGQVIGAEILLRWKHPDKGIISPAEFIPSAEETGLIVPIGEWVLRDACQTLVHWSKIPAKAKIVLAVNVSVIQFSKPNFVKTVLNALAFSGANPHRLKLEITESLLANNVPDVVGKMDELKRHGVSFAIDDFGTGYSSLFYLKRLPIDQLKIDQSFIREMLQSPNDQAIAQTVITLAKTMGLDVIAEGVETEEQRTMLLEMGCEFYQGYLFGKPCELADFIF